DNHTYADHQMPNCNSNELYKGVMTDRSTAVFNGKIMVHKEAQKTNAFQSNQNILLTDTATINTKPELEIYADDVKCSHGCTIGQLDEEAMFYLQTRGLGREAATNLLIQAFAGEVLDQITIEPLKRNMEDFFLQKFDKLNA
ncbi:MAG: SufD family Fe-S cluster assembly protein, partial [Salibacteraceae bacterium]